MTTDEKELREARLQLFKAVQKSPKLLATGQRAKAPTAAQESLRAINAAATKLLSATNASLSDLTEALSLLEDAQLWVLDPGSSKAQEDVPALRAKLKRFQALVENAREVEGLSKKEKKAEADRLRIDLAGQLVAPQDDERRALANDFREVCDLLDRRITRARNRRRSSSSQEDDGHSSVLGWITNLWPLHRKEPQVQQVQVDVRAPLQEWSATESFQARPIPRLDAASLNRLTADARMLSEATERVASMVQQQDESLDAVEDDVHQTVEETREVVGTLAEVALGKSRSRVSKATIAVGASSAVMGMVLGAPLLGTLALASGTATVTALAGNAIHGRYRRKVQEVASSSQ
ncbi:unnamed protein product [Durusdinium trenchii]|uniref:t-SNARE coiled-coil homology domain-containing protein n=1 Tax=Durusdinium trenchii TaxID=1381693 RepID=A0ABP0MF57_9DINO